MDFRWFDLKKLLLANSSSFVVCWCELSNLDCKNNIEKGFQQQPCCVAPQTRNLNDFAKFPTYGFTTTGTTVFERLGFAFANFSGTESASEFILMYTTRFVLCHVHNYMTDMQMYTNANAEMTVTPP